MTPAYAGDEATPTTASQERPVMNPGSAEGIGVLDAVRGLLAAAYADDSLMHWIFPDAGTRPAAIAAWLGLFAESYLADGSYSLIGGESSGPEPGVEPGVEWGSELDAVACWRRPGASAPAPQAPTIGALLTAIVGPDHARAVGASLGAIRDVTPSEAHLYLHLLAVRPDRQGLGLGRRLIQQGIARATEYGVPVHLETTSEPAVRFYQRIGFEITGELDLPGGGPHLWAMGGSWS